VAEFAGQRGPSSIFLSAGLLLLRQPTGTPCAAAATLAVLSERATHRTYPFVQGAYGKSRAPLGVLCKIIMLGRGRID
jgi:hypothetical protein